MKSYRQNFKAYLNDLGAKRPSPGGGSAVCVLFCLGVSLIEKAIQYSLSSAPGLNKDIGGLKALRKKIFPYIDLDARIFHKIMKAKGAQRVKAVKQGEALIVDVAGACEKGFVIAKGARKKIKKVILSDFNIGVECLRVVMMGCLANLEANKVMFGRDCRHAKIFKKALKKWERS